MDKISIITIISLVILVFSSIIYLEVRKDKCHDLGGIYIDTQCFKADLIKLDNK